MGIPSLNIDEFDDIDSCKNLWSEVLRLAVRDWKWINRKGPCPMTGTQSSKGYSKEFIKSELIRFFFEPNERFDIAIGACELDKDAFRCAMRRVANV